MFFWHWCMQKFWILHPGWKKFDITPKTKIKDRNKTAFEQVQKHIKNGDSYLLNLTFPSEVSFEDSLKELFLASNAQHIFLVINL